MTQTSEYVALGHPDAVCDHVASFLLDRYIEKDPKVRFAIEVQAKDNHICIGGEVTSSADFADDYIRKLVRDAVRDIGYTEEYADRWGRENCIDPSAIDIDIHIGRQSPDIAQGVNADGWGDQGIMWGMATGDESTDFMPRDHYLAKRLGVELYKAAIDGAFDIGIDIKTQVTCADGKPVGVIVAAPMRGSPDEIDWQRKMVSAKIHEVIGMNGANAVINGTGAYVRHASQGDCGTTGRKLAVDFYGGGCRIGGGAPWGKDPSKADVSLNVYAREIALKAKRETGEETVYAQLSCCIGRKEIGIALFNGRLEQIGGWMERRPAPEIIAELGLYAPVYAFKKRNGLFVRP